MSYICVIRWRSKVYAGKCFANIAQSFLNSNKNQEKVMNKIKKSVLSPSIIAFHGYF